MKYFRIYSPRRVVLLPRNSLHCFPHYWKPSKAMGSRCVKPLERYFTVMSGGGYRPRSKHRPRIAVSPQFSTFLVAGNSPGKFNLLVGRPTICSGRSEICEMKYRLIASLVLHWFSATTNAFWKSLQCEISAITSVAACGGGAAIDFSQLADIGTWRLCLYYVQFWYAVGNRLYSLFQLHTRPACL